MIGIFRKIPHARSLAIFLAAVALYAFLGFLVVPRLIERAVPDYAAEHLQRKATVGKVRFHPFLLKLDVRDLALAENNGAPIVGFKRLLVDFELSSVVRWAWTFSRIVIEGLDFNVELRPDGRLNLALLAESFLKPESAGGGGSADDQPPPRLLFQHIALSGAAVTFSDHSNPAHASATLKPINLELRDISTLPERRGPHVIRAQVPGGGVLSWSGETSLHPIFSSGEIRLKGGRPETVWRFLRDETHLSEPKGAVDISARYRFSYAKEMLQLVVEDIRVNAKGIGLTPAGAQDPILALDVIEASGGRFDFGARAVTLPEIAVRGGSAVVDVDTDGRLNWQKLVKTSTASDPSAGTARQGKPWKVKLDSVRIADVALHYADNSRAIPLAVSSEGAQASVTAVLEAGATETQVAMSELAITLSGVKWREAGVDEPLVVLDQLALAGGALDLRETSFAVKHVAIKGGMVKVSRDGKGNVRIVEVVSASKTAKVARELEAALERAREKGQGWRFDVDALEIEGVRVALLDQGFEDPIAFDLEDVTAAVKNIRSDGKTPIQFDAQVRITQGGSARATGEVGADGERITASAKIERFNLKPLQPLVARYSALRLESGVVSSTAKIAYQGGKARPNLQVTGALDVGGLLLNEASSGERLLEWKSLAAKGVSFRLDPGRLEVEEVRLVEPGTKIVIFKDRSLNLAKVLEPSLKQQNRDAPPSPAEERKTAEKPSSRPPSSRAPTEIAVGAVVVEKGVVDFADLSLVLPFAAKVEELLGSVAGISSASASRAAVKLEGRVGESGRAQVEGSLNPFAPKAFMDLGVAFRKVSMPPLSPYSVTFAGRKIATGQLTLDLRYKIENSRLAGDNKILLEQFTLGEPVKSPSALDLPLDLAVALLTDSEGKINVAVPVSGNMEDPKFDYGHLIGQALGTLIKGIVTAPFRALGGLLGGGGENLDSLGFEPGADALLPAEREKLKGVATALGKRPQLKLVLEGQYGEKDGAALRQRDVATAVALKLGRPVAPGEPVVPVNPAEAKTQRALEAVFVERNAAKVLTQFALDFGKERGKPVSRVNALLAAAGKPSTDVQFYEAVLKRLTDSAQITEEALLKIAQARAQNVSDHLVKTLAVPAARVQKAAASKGGEQVKLALDVVRQAAR